MQNTITIDKDILLCTLALKDNSTIYWNEKLVELSNGEILNTQEYLIKSISDGRKKLKGLI